MHAEAMALGISSIDFMWMEPCEYRLVVEKIIQYRKYDNREIKEAIRMLGWHLSHSKLNYKEFSKNHFPLSYDNDDAQPKKEIVSPEDYIKEKNNISKIHQQIRKSLNK